jgi:carboxypeptidase Q
MTNRAFATAVLGLAVFAGQTRAQKAAQKATAVEKVDMGTVGMLRDEGLNRSHIPDDARYLTDVIGPRLTGSLAMKRADEWVVRKMREYGLENVHLEAWRFGRGWEEVSYFGRMTEPFIRPLSGRALA